MAFFPYMLRRTHCVSSPTRQNKNRKRLQKSRPDRKLCERFYACKDIGAVKSCEALVLDDDDDDSDSSCYESSIAQQSVERSPRIGHLLSPSFGNDSVKYSSISKRTRAKTPVFAIGQLEKKLALEAVEDTAQSLAEQYRAILPSRSATPFIAPLVTRSISKGLRKVKSRESILSVAKNHLNGGEFWHSGTLVDSQATSSPISPTHSDAINAGLFMFQNDQGLKAQNEEFPDLVSETEDNSGLWICMELLTSELVRAFFRRHPVENEDRASRLQILLMIEACEDVQRQIRQKRHSCRVMDKDEKSMQAADEVLEHWLQVLYSVYDLSEHSISQN